MPYELVFYKNLNLILKNCGPFALAFAHCLLSGRNPTALSFNAVSIREWMMECITSEILTELSSVRRKAPRMNRSGFVFVTSKEAEKLARKRQAT